jgi:hypothetical protein
VWSQSSQQEKLEQRKAEIQKRLENEKMLLTLRGEISNECFLIQKNKIRLKEKLINTTEKQRKLLANDMYINQMKINKLNKNWAFSKKIMLR